MIPPHLDLVLAQAPAGSSGACQSRIGRELLTQLAARHGFNCPARLWSARGKGAPLHPDLPRPWQACLSHSDQRIVAGLASVPVGMDIEHIRPRHRTRLKELIALLPEPEVRQQVTLSCDPLLSFYQAWTLHEALFKLESLSGTTLSHVLSTRLAQLIPDGNVQAWQWQQAGWILSICCRHQLEIRILPDLAIRKYQRTRGLPDQADTNR